MRRTGERGTLNLWAMVVVLIFTAAAIAAAAPTVYVDTSAIDARTDLTTAQKEAVKQAMVNTIKSNLDEAFGPGNTVVTTDAAQKNTANRTVTIDGTTPGTGVWGRWQHGSSGTTVYLKNYMDRGDNRFKNADGSWDTTKLGTALGTTAAHEVGHSYSASHDDTNINKMNTENSATEIGGGLHFNDAAETTMRNNRNNAPCNPSARSTEACCIADHSTDPVFPDGQEIHESGSITTSFLHSGPMATMFDFGWWGTDTDDGLIDGNPFGDFIYKSSMTSTYLDSPTITFFDGWTVNFVLRGSEDSPFAGEYFQIDPTDVVYLNPVVQPDGDHVFRDLDLRWFVDADPVPDVMIHLSANVYGPGNQAFSGFRPGTPMPKQVVEAKRQVDGRLLTLAGSVITASFPGYFYVESIDRASGIRVNWPHPMPEYTSAIVEGEIRTGANGERQIDALSVTPAVGVHIGPLGMPNRSVGGGDFEYIAGLWPSGQQGVTNGVGLNNIGLLVRSWGNYTYLDQNTFIINDGSGSGIKCITQAEFPAPPHCNYAVVTGISSCESGTGGIQPVILLRHPDDLISFY